MAAYLNRIATAVPENDVHNAFVDYAETLLPDSRTQRVFRRMAERRAGPENLDSWLSGVSA